MKRVQKGDEHKVRLARLIQVMLESDVRIKHYGVTYTSKKGDGAIKIQDLIMQVTEMSGRAFEEYLREIELDFKFTDLGKVYNYPGKIINGIKPYLKVDGEFYTRQNSLLTPKSFSFENNLPNYAENGAQPQSISEFYAGFYKDIINELVAYKVLAKHGHLNIKPKVSAFGNSLSAFAESYRDQDALNNVKEIIIHYVDQMIDYYSEMANSSGY